MLNREEKISLLMGKYQYDSVEWDDWFIDDIENWKSEMRAEGIISADDIYFDLHRSSGANIIGSFDVYAFIRKNAAGMIKAHKLNPFELRKALKSKEAYYYFDANVSLGQTNYGNQEINYDYCTDYDTDDAGNEPDENISAFFEEHLYEWIQEHVEEWGYRIHASLEKSYDYYISEECVIESLQAREVIDENLDFIDPEESIYPEEDYWEETTEPEPAPAEYAEAA